MNETKIGFSPDWVATTGDTLNDLLEDRGMTIRELSDKSGLTVDRIHRLLYEDELYTQEVARRLENVFGVPASFWKNRDRIYHERQAKLNSD